MAKEILYTTALDEAGRLVHINDAEKGASYRCPLCKNEFILRKSGKTGRGSRRPHFAHNEVTPNCTPESVLHYSFIRQLVDLLEKYKRENKPLTFNWVCSSCGYKNSDNLLGKTVFVETEYGLGACRPDIALLDGAKNVLGVIEIVVTHKPEESTLEYFRTNKIALIQINLTSEDDLTRVEEKVKSPSFVDLCLSHKCKDRAKYRINRKVLPLQGRCQLCLSDVHVFKVGLESPFSKRLVRDFTEDELNLVKSKFSRILIREDTATKEKYPITECLGCLRLRSRYNTRRL